MTATTVDFTLTDVVREVRALANQQPNFVYSAPGDVAMDGNCYYLHGEKRDEPGCIVGQALSRLGYQVPLDMEGTHAGQVLGNLFGFKWGFGSDDTSAPDEARWVRVVQSHQDEHKPWVEAVQAADRAIDLTVNA